jgi:hypothetical protein
VLPVVSTRKPTETTRDDQRRGQLFVKASLLSPNTPIVFVMDDDISVWESLEALIRCR